MQVLRWLSRRVSRRGASLRFDHVVWTTMIDELRRRGGGRREAGAFLLGSRDGEQRRVVRVVYLDDLDPDCLVGNIHLHGDAYSALWTLCDREQRRVIGDIHTHPGTSVKQSRTDQDNPMVARRGHLALIAPDFATRAVSPRELGVHEYLGEDGWRSHFGRQAKRRVYVGRWA